MKKLTPAQKAMETRLRAVNAALQPIPHAQRSFFRKRSAKNVFGAGIEEETQLLRVLFDTVELSLKPQQRYSLVWRTGQNGCDLELLINIRTFPQAKKEIER